MAINPISPVPATKLDPAPKTTRRNNPGAIATDKTLVDVEPVAERRRNPDRRRDRDQRRMDRRLGADRRKRTVDISV